MKDPMAMTPAEHKLAYAIWYANEKKKQEEEKKKIAMRTGVNASERSGTGKTIRQERRSIWDEPEMKFQKEE